MKMKSILFAWVLVVLFPCCMKAEEKTSPQPGHLELAITYDAQYAAPGASNSFVLQGGSAQIHGQFWRGLGVVADIYGTHNGNMHNSGVGLDLVTATFGPRYTYQLPHRKLNAYGQFLVGEAFGMNSVFPDPSGALSSASSMALQGGGGINYHLKSRLDWRALEAGWLYTQLPNGANQTEHNLRIGTGLVWRFK